MQQSFSPPPSLFTFQPSSAVQRDHRLPSFPSLPYERHTILLTTHSGGFPSDLRYPAVFGPASVITANVVPSSILSLAPSQVSPQVAGPVQPNLLHSAQPSHAMHAATGMPLIYYSLRVPAFQQDSVARLCCWSRLLPYSPKTVVAITSGQYIDLATLITPQQQAPVPIISMDGRVVLTAPPRSSHRINDISDWLQAFTIIQLLLVYIPLLHVYIHLLSVYIHLLPVYVQFLHVYIPLLHVCIQLLHVSIQLLHVYIVAACLYVVAACLYTVAACLYTVAACLYTVAACLYGPLFQCLDGTRFLRFW